LEERRGKMKVKKPPDPKPQSLKPFMCTQKTSLKSIAKDNVIPILQEVVQRSNVIVNHASKLLKLYLLYLFEEKKEFPVIDENLIVVAMKVVSIKGTTRGRKDGDETLEKMATLRTFYEEHYKPLLHPEEIQLSRLHLTIIFNYEATTILTSYDNNIIAHFVDYCNELVNRHFKLKDSLKQIDQKTDVSKEDKIQQKRDISIALRKVKNDLLSPKDTPFTSDEEYHKWLNETKPQVISKTQYLEDSIHYDLAARPLDYFKSYIYVCRELEKFERFVQSIPIRTSNCPSYILIDTSTLGNMTGNQKKQKEKISEVDVLLWDKYFHIHEKVFGRKDYTFHHQIRTDGVRVSITLRRSDRKAGKQFTKKTEQKALKELIKEQYIDELSDEEKDRLRKKGVLSGDPGMEDLLYFVNGTFKESGKAVHYRYSSNQRRSQTKQKKYQAIRQTLKNAAGVDESVLSNFTKKTSFFQGFKDYLSHKLPLSYNLKDFYETPIWRKLKWNAVINRKRSESKMVNKLQEVLGSHKDNIIVIGNWSNNGHHMKGKEPTKGKGLRKTLRDAGFEVFLAKEQYSSCTCHCCHGETEKFRYRKSENPKHKGEMKKVHGLLRCKSQNECKSLWNRDANGALNILEIAKCALHKWPRPLAFSKKEPMATSSVV
jgi:hypothetical protein